MTRLGVIGCGYQSSNLVRSVFEGPDAEIVAVNDLGPEASEVRHVQ
jgi:hypothetical protein